MNKKIVTILIMIFMLVFSFNVEAITVDQIEDEIIFKKDAIVNNQVDGDLLSFSGDIDINAKVEGSFRGIAENVIINNDINKNVACAGRTVGISKNSNINGYLVVAGYDVIHNGNVKKDMKVYGNNVIINGQIDGNLYVQANYIKIDKNAIIKGNVNLYSNNEIFISDSVTILGKRTVGDIDTVDNRKNMINKGDLFFSIFKILSMFVVGMLIIIFNKHIFVRTYNLIDGSIFKTMLIGFAAFIFIPIISILLMFTIVGIIPSMLLILLYILAIMLSKIFVAIYISQKMNKDINMYLGLFIGLIIIEILGYIPVINFLTLIVYLFLGLGVIIKGMFETRKV